MMMMMMMSLTVDVDVEVHSSLAASTPLARSCLSVPYMHGSMEIVQVHTSMEAPNPGSFHWDQCWGLAKHTIHSCWMSEHLHYTGSGFQGLTKDGKLFKIVFLRIKADVSFWMLSLGSFSCPGTPRIVCRDSEPISSTARSFDIADMCIFAYKF